MRPYTFTVNPKRGKLVKITVRAIDDKWGEPQHYVYESPRQPLRAQSQRSKDVLAAIERDALVSYGHVSDIVTDSMVITKPKEWQDARQISALRDETAEIVARSDEYAKALAAAQEELHKYDDGVRPLLAWCARLRGKLNHHDHDVQRGFEQAVTAIIEEMALGPELPWVTHVADAYKRNAGIPAGAPLLHKSTKHLSSNKPAMPTTEDLAAAIEAWKEVAGES